MKKKPVEKFLPISDEDLVRLSKENSGITLKKNIRHRIRITHNKLPVQSDEFKNAVSTELNKRILRLNFKKNDVILRLINIQIVKPVIANLCRKINVKCVADMFVFQPKFNQIMTATVNKKSKNHIGCVMYDVFNVAIVKPDAVSHDLWLGRDVQVNDQISFKVIKIDVAEMIPYIVGELIADNEDAASCREIDERDSVISLDPSSSEGHFSELDDVLETLHDNKTKKRKLSEGFSEELTPKRRKIS